MASSLPRVASSISAGDAVERGQALDQRLRLRLGIAIEARRGGIARGPPGRFVGMQARQRRQPRRMRIGLRARRSPGAPATSDGSSSRRAPAQRREPDAHRRRMRIQALELRQDLRRRAQARAGPPA